MNDFIIEKVSFKPKLKSPILIEGFPGVGNVARIVVDFLINKLKAKLYLRVYSKYFPNTSFINEDNLIDLPKVEFYYYKNKKGKDLVFVIGDAQPGESNLSYDFCNMVLDITQSMNIKEIITLGGIAASSPESKPKVYGAVTHKEYLSKLTKIGVNFDRKGVVVLIGAAGLLLGLGSLRSMKGFTLLAETLNQNKLGFAAAKSILEVLNKYLNLSVPLDSLNPLISDQKQNLEHKKLIKKIKEQEELSHLSEHRYIG